MLLSFNAAEFRVSLGQAKLYLQMFVPLLDFAHLISDQRKFKDKPLCESSFRLTL